MRLILPWMLGLAALAAGCYQQPVLSPQRALRCTSSEAKGECPTGYSCVANRLCAPDRCDRTEDCPTGLACANRSCVLIPDGGVLPDGSVSGFLFDGPIDLVQDTSPDTAMVPGASSTLDGGRD